MSNQGNKHLSYGLTKRMKADGIAISKKRKFHTNSLGFNDDSDDNDDDDLAAHQDASRRRSMAALAAATEKGEASIYDYDGLYETWQKKKENEHEIPDPGQGETKKSRYVEKLLSTAKNRKRELESTWDKKRAKELREEELANQELYQGKEQFVTEAYRKKLQEQQRWREAQERMEEQERDVTQMDKVGFSGSSAALLRNVIHGNTNQQELDASYSPPKEMNEANVVPPPSTIISQGQTNSTTFNIGKGGVSKERFPSSASKLQAEEIKANDWKAERIALLQQRESKLAAARDRYFARINLVS